MVGRGSAEGAGAAPVDVHPGGLVDVCMARSVVGGERVEAGPVDRVAWAGWVGLVERAAGGEVRLRRGAGYRRQGWKAVVSAGMLGGRLNRGQLGSGDIRKRQRGWVVRL